MNILLLTKSSVAVSVLLVLIIAIYFAYSGDESGTTRLPGVSTHIPNTANKAVETVWQWGHSLTSASESITEAHDNVETYSSSIFTEETVYNALRRVRVDNQNNVIVDHETLVALNETFNGSHLRLGDQALSELQSIIRRGLPGVVGNQVARIVRDYYHLLEASKEFNAVYEANSSTEQYSERTTEEHEENYRELTELREMYLGHDIANKLFSTSNANANYMFDMLKLVQNTHLTHEEKLNARAEITERYTEQTIDVRDWHERRQAFLNAKQNILMASISDEEKQAQVIELTHQHFSVEELAHVSHMQLDKL